MYHLCTHHTSDPQHYLKLETKDDGEIVIYFDHNNHSILEVECSWSLQWKTMYAYLHNLALDMFYSCLFALHEDIAYRLEENIKLSSVVGRKYLLSFGQRSLW